MSNVIIGCRLPNGIMAQVGATKIRLNGANADNASNGFGFTRVPADFAEAWLKDDGEGGRRTVTKRGGVFLADSMDDARAIAREMSGERSGFERIDPDKAAPGIVPTDETKKELAKNADAAEAAAGTGGRGRGRRATAPVE
jgi:hypothetical protein